MKVPQLHRGRPIRAWGGEPCVTAGLTRANAASHPGPNHDASLSEQLAEVLVRRFVVEPLSRKHRSMPKKRWFGVRVVHVWPEEDPARYEERVTLWRAASFGDAISRAEEEAVDYATSVGAQYLDFAQAYALDEDETPSDGVEVFSLMRTSDLGPSEYLDRHFATGTEFQHG
jgi:hypothetical protein